MFLSSVNEGMRCFLLPVAVLAFWTRERRPLKVKKCKDTRENALAAVFMCVMAGIKESAEVIHERVFFFFVKCWK